MSAFMFCKIISIILAVIGISMALPAVTALCCHEYSMLAAFTVPLLISIALASVFLLTKRRDQISLSVRAVFALVASVWFVLCFFGAIPLAASGFFPSFADAFFETVSGFSTTGASVLSDVESLPRSINLWRCEMHWLGGMGVIALTVALMPLLGVGGFALIKAESTGVEKGKITPKIANTAKVLWLLYLSFTAVQAVLLLFCGMDVIDALSYAFSTLGTGGYATRNDSIASYHSVPIEIVCTIFMFLAGINFSLYFYFIARKFDEVKKNTEFKTYLALFFGAVLLVALMLIPHFGSVAKAVRYGSFQVASIMTTTGFSTSNYTAWPPAAQFVILLLFFVGGSAGSTSGGFKVVRWVVLAKQAHNEILRMLHPHGVFTVRLNGMPGRKDLVLAVAAFTFVYFLLVGVTTFLGTIAGLEVFSAFTGALSMIGNVGPAFGMLNPSENLGFLPSWLKWWYCFVMLAGRLELYNLIIFFVPEYWKK